jgi:CPA2 family monovalent cation:H+ antiporter-2
VVVLVLLPTMVSPGVDASAVATRAALAAFKVAALVAFTVLVGRRAIPWVLERVARTRSRELFTLTVLVIALGIAVGAALAFGVSMALGAFLAGLVVGRSEFSLRAANEAMPMRDAFAVLFFVSVGMLLDPMHLVRQPILIGATVAVVLLAKPLGAFAIVRSRRYPLGTALLVAVALAQIGEFSFILGTVGRELGLLDASATNTIVAAAIVSITLNPLLYRIVDPIAARLSRRRIARVLETAVEDGSVPDTRHRAVVVGYGPTGRAIVRLLRENGVAPTVVELNLDAIRWLRDEGIDAVYGDATHRQTLVKADLSHAGTLILSSASMHADVDVIRTARELNRRIRILARAAYLRDVPALRAAGADRVSAAEAEIALAFTEAVLRELGATPEQIDRERDRVHGDLFGR